MLRGQVDFCSNDRTMTCTAGTFVHVPAGTVHGFRFGSGGGEMLEITGGQSRAIEMFTAMARELPPGPPEVTGVAAVAGPYGLGLHL